MKNVIKLHNYYSPLELEQAIEKWGNYYNDCRYHKSLDNLTPADVYFGRGAKILEQRKIIKQNTIKHRRNNYLNYKLNLIV